MPILFNFNLNKIEGSVFLSSTRSSLWFVSIFSVHFLNNIVPPKKCGFKDQLQV